MKKKILNDNKTDIKRQRIKTYFLEAAKEIILSEGMENISVRKVADIAGYSYATIYNYFADLNELLWYTKSLLIKDIAEYMYKRIKEPLYDIQGIKKLLRIYIEYYFENPNVFRFFYFHSLNKPEKGDVVSVDEPNFDEIWKETLMGFVLDGILREKDIQVISKIFIYSMHGMIALCFSNNGDLTEARVYEDLEQIVDFLLLRK